MQQCIDIPRDEVMNCRMPGLRCPAASSITSSSTASSCLAAACLAAFDAMDTDGVCGSACEHKDPLTEMAKGGRTADY